ncbi:MAG TPA: deoxyribonuclease IV, partial [Verrucomicrobiae bacterium]|nr:deoxyribonuclease IV [Verrucomicrobiae bacterium]
IYLINLAAAPGEIKEKSMAGFLEEMVRCAKLGIDKIVMHPGSHLGEGVETGISRIVEALDCLLERAEQYTGKILLELTAGQGTNIGNTFEEIAGIISRSRYGERFGVCYDTCHTFAAGYDITTADAYAKTFAKFDSIIGLQRLMAFHINDTKKGLGSRIDRHEHIGDGSLGLEPFRLLANDPRFEKVPKILETPKGDDNEMDAVNLQRLRALVGKPS